MKLERIKIEGYRSLKSVEWRPAALNVLIGANATGKSNFLRALELLPAAVKGELKESVLQLGGMAPLLWNGEASAIRFDLVTAQEDGTGLSFETSLHRLGDTGSFEVGDETLCAGSERILVDERGIKYDDTESILSDRFGRFDEVRTNEFQRYLRSWTVYHDLRSDQHAAVRQSTVARYERQIDPDGQNLIAVLHTLYTGDRNFEEQIDDAMRAAFPNDYEKLSFPAVPEHGRIQMGVRWRGGRRQPTTADLSDGTLRFLMLAAILLTPDPPALIAIDEPETGLHPGMLPVVAELAEAASEKSQVIISTHSPEFLDAFESPPAVTVFEWDQDHTTMSRIDGEQLDAWLKDYTLGKFAFSGAAEAIS